MTTKQKLKFTLEEKTAYFLLLTERHGVKNVIRFLLKVIAGAGAERGQNS